MLQRLFQRFKLQGVKSLVKPLLAIGLALALLFGPADGAWAAKAGGRIGGGRFAPAPRMAPAPTSRAPMGGGYYPGGGFGIPMPFIFPLFGFGGGFGGLFTLLMVLAIANFLVNSFRRSGEGDSDTPGTSSNPPVAVAKLQVGLLANARSLQDDLNRIALTADTGSTPGLAKLLQETTLALLRHPEYWVYGASEKLDTRLLNAEQAFNRYTLAVRSQFTEETLSNVNNQLTQATPKATPPALPTDDLATPGEYILATLVVASQGKLDLPDVRSTEDLRQALGQVGAIASDALLAVEVLWTPQQSGETLSADEMIAEYPHLRLL